MPGPPRARGRNSGRRGASGRGGAAPSVPRGHTMVAAHEFAVGLHGPLQCCLRLPGSFAAIYQEDPPPGLWLQRDDCPNGPNWVRLELGDDGLLGLSQGWRTFAHAQRLLTDQVLLFRYDRVSILFVTVFECPGGRVECCTEGDTMEDDGGEDNSSSSSSGEEEEDEENLPRVKEEDRDSFPG